MAWSKEKMREYQRAYREKHKDDNVGTLYSRYKETSIASKKKHNKKYPERYKARYQAMYKIKRQVCEVDGCDILGERHHDDYNKPLDVRFLCKEHHGRKNVRISTNEVY